MKNIMDSKKRIRSCTGCEACASICPVGIIAMKMDAEGFWYPGIAEPSACISCGRCLAVCKADSATPESAYSPVVSFEAKRDEDCRAGSSGGFIGLLSAHIIASGGVVFGAVFNAEAQEVYHSSSEDYPLDKLLRSKYVQSRTAGVFVRVKQTLHEGRPVLFCGTPCQTEGLLAYLGKRYVTLITVDFYCHGVPSPGFFKEMIRSYEMRHEERATDVTFREKDLGWRALIMKLYFLSGKVIAEPSADQYYYYFFLNNYSLRPIQTACFRFYRSGLLAKRQNRR